MTLDVQRQREESEVRERHCLHQGDYLEGVSGGTLRISHKNPVLGTVISKTVQGQRARLTDHKSTGQLRNALLFISLFPPLTRMEPEAVLGGDRREDVKGRETEEKLTLPLLPRCLFPSWRQPCQGT